MDAAQPSTLRQNAQKAKEKVKVLASRMMTAKRQAFCNNPQGRITLGLAWLA
jgi:hypothetical protein